MKNVKKSFIPYWIAIFSLSFFLIGSGFYINQIKQDNADLHDELSFFRDGWEEIVPESDGRFNPQGFKICRMYVSVDTNTAFLMECKR